MLLSSARRFAGRRISVDLDHVRFPDGSTGVLEMVRHPGAAAVVPFLDPPSSPDPRVLLLRQFRHAADGDLWEIPAGTLDSGEDPVRCAERELAEEAGRQAASLRHLTTVFTTPGFTDERIHLYLAEGLRAVPASPERDEFLEPVELRWSRIGAMIAAGEIADAKTLVALMYVHCFVRTRPEAPEGVAS